MSAILVKGPFALLLREMMYRAAFGSAEIVIVTVLSVVLARVKLGALSGPSCSHCVTSGGTLKSSTITGEFWLPASPEEVDVALTPTP